MALGVERIGKIGYLSRAMGVDGSTLSFGLAYGVVGAVELRNVAVSRRIAPAPEMRLRPSSQLLAADGRQPVQRNGRALIDQIDRSQWRAALAGLNSSCCKGGADSVVQDRARNRAGSPKGVSQGDAA
jgi:hypothetical protein